MNEKEKQAEILNKEFFNSSCENFGNVGWQSSCYIDEHMQTVYYHSILKHINISNSKSIIDIGCGQGDLLDFLKKRKINIEYKGIDVSEKMTQYAKEKHPEHSFEAISLLDLKEAKYDNVLSIGAFNVRLQDPEYQIQYLEKNIKKMYSMCNKSCAFTLLSSHGYEQISQEKQLFCYEPWDILKLCFKLTDSVVLDHCSIPIEFIVVLYK